MKKLLLGTSALVALAAGAANAHPLQVMLGGTIDSQMGIVDQHDGYDYITDGFTSGQVDRDADDRKAHKMNFFNKADVYVSVKHKGENGWLYGGFAGLNTNASYDDNKPTQSKRTYIWMENKLGHFEFGSNYGVDAMMKVDATSIARGTGGINGQWFHYANLHTGQTNNMISTNNPSNSGVTLNPMQSLALDSAESTHKHFNISPNLMTTAVSEMGQEDARKFTYMTPRMWGFQGGLSFTPDAGQFGNTSKAVLETPDVSGGTCCGHYVPTAVGTEFHDAKNVWTLAGNYLGRVDNIDFKLAMAGNLGDRETRGHRHLREFLAGGSVAFHGFHLAASYVNSGKSLMSKSGDSTGAHGWTAGGSYVSGPVGASVTYFRSAVNRNRFQNLSLGGDYLWQPRLTLYADATILEYEPPAVNAQDAS